MDVSISPSPQFLQTLLGIGVRCPHCENPHFATLAVYFSHLQSTHPGTPDALAVSQLIREAAKE